MKLKNITFKEGNLSGITLNMDPEYVPYIFDNGDIDREMINSIEEDFSKGKTIFDVGAFIGSSSLVFAKCLGEKGSVISFEPNPYNLKKIEKNLSLNSKLSKIIKVYDIALADEEGEMQMVLSDDVDSGPSSTSRLDSSHSTIRSEDLPSSFRKFKVQASTIDLFVKKNKITPDVIKVDIEGAEDKFLLGAKKTLETCKPVLYIEMHSEYCTLKCTEILHSLGYALFVLREEKDNRVMVKAVPTSKIPKISIEDKEKIALKSVEISIRLLQNSDRWNDEIVRKNAVIDKYCEENKSLANSNDLLKEEVNKLKEVISSMENSKSWKLTKPLRLAMKILRK